MPHRKRIIVLANSVKHDPGRCIAGREIVEENNVSRLGGWIRPIGRIGEGELYPQHFSYENGSAPRFLDVVQFDVESAGTDATQPENWLISEGKPWTKITEWPYERINELLEDPTSLWLQPDIKTDRTTMEYIAANPPPQSLYFLQIDNAEIYMNDRNRIRMCFNYEGSEYDLSVTDTLIGEVADGRIALKKVLACVSLAPAFYNKYDGQYYHYKVAASVIRYE
ncbi:MAG: dual OB domain-containing protein [Thermoleophilia bacterium]